MTRLATGFALCCAFTGCATVDGDGPPTDTGPVLPCAPTDDPVLEIAQSDGDYGALVDGVLIEYGMPPQGGAPYAPFRVRVWGLDQDDLGLTVDMTAVQLDDGAELGVADYVQWFVCANVGDNAGYRVASEFHMRFYGWSLEELDAREVEVRISAENGVGERVDTAFTGFLSWSL